MSNLVRLCPGCGKVNEAREQSCPDCGSSLWREPRVDADLLQAGGAIRNAAGAGATEDVRGTDAAPRQEVEETRRPADGGESAWLECAEQPATRFPVNRSGILGRKGDIDISSLPGSPYISRRHVAITYIDEHWYVKNLSEASITRLNAVTLPSGTTATIAEGDKLTCGKTTFIFRAGGG